MMNRSRTQWCLTLLAVLAACEGVKAVEGTPDGEVAGAAHTGTIWSLAVSPDGKVLAAGSEDQTIGLYDTATGARLRVLRGHTGLIRSVRFSPDGKLLASGSLDGSIHLWNPATGAEVRTIKDEAPVFFVAFTPDGKQLASGSETSTARRWDVRTGVRQTDLAGSDGKEWAVAISPDGKQVVTGGSAGRLTFRDWETNTVRYLVSGFGAGVNSLTFSPDSKQLAFATTRGAVHVMDLESRRTTAYGGRMGVIYECAYSPDGRRIAAVGADGDLRVFRWDGGGPSLTFVRAHTGGAMSVAFTPDGRFCYTGGADSRIRRWKVLAEASGPLPDEPQKPVIADTSGLTPDQRRKLVAAAVFPSLASIQFNVELDAGELLWPDGEPKELPKRIATAERAARERPKDAKARLVLADLYDEAKRENDARRLRSEAVTLARERTRAANATAADWVTLGTALEETGDSPEAEKALRKATAAGPEDWRAWSALGIFQWFKALGVLWPAGSAVIALTRGSRLERKLATLPEPSQLPKLLAETPVARVPQARALLAEARDSFQRAAMAKPDESSFYIARWLFRAFGDELFRLLEVPEQVRADPEAAAAWFQKALFTDAAPDLEQAARLRPRMVRLTNLVCGVTVIGAGASGRLDGIPAGDPAIWKALSPPEQARIQDALDRLSTLTRDSDPRVAAEAAEAHGVYSFVAKGDPQSAITSLKTAVEKEPNRLKAWTLLIELLWRAKRYEEMQALYRTFGNVNGEAAAWLSYARLHRHLEKPGVVELNISRALAVEPQSPEANLFQAAFLLAKDDPSLLKAAAERLGTAAPQAEGPLEADYQRLAGIYNALIGNKATAIAMLEQSLTEPPGSEQANEAARLTREALAALRG